MGIANQPDRLLNLFRAIMLGTLRGDGVDLTARQLAVLLTATLGRGPHTVRGLAAELKIAKPAISRALDRLGDLGLAVRRVDPDDRRSVQVEPTAEGIRYVQGMRLAITAEAEAQGIPPEQSQAKRARPA